jgi:hypothetical protein
VIVISPTKRTKTLMRILRLSLIVLCTSGCVSTSVEHEETVAPETNKDPFSEQSAVRSRFLLKLRQLATEGDLFDPDSIARILDMRLHAVTQTREHTIKDCGDGSMRWIEATNVSASDPVWYRALPSGAGHLDIPAFTINPASRTGDPIFTYEIFHSIACRDWPRMRDHTSASLAFENLPAFSCVTPASITREIPEARFSPGTDGVSLMIVEGRINDDASVKLRFVFRFGVSCALGAEVLQDQEDGLRYQRAVAKYKACRLPADREFCASHPSFTRSDRDLYREMVLNAYRRCGLINDFYIKEPHSGEAPVTETEGPIRLRQSPCEGI